MHGRDSSELRAAKRKTSEADLLLRSLLRPLIQTLPLFYQQIFRAESSVSWWQFITFQKCLVVGLYNSHNFTSIWPAAGGYFPNFEGEAPEVMS